MTAGIETMRARARIVPVASVLAGSLAAAAPIVANAPVLPPMGLLTALAWRQLRPELWPAWMALPLGLADDLLSGQPLGIGMASWTLIFLAIDRIDRALPARDHWIDWAIAAAAIVFALAAGLLAAWRPPAGLVTILPQIAVSILCFPAVMRAVAAFDRWRLRR